MYLNIYIYFIRIYIIHICKYLGACLNICIYVHIIHTRTHNIRTRNITTCIYICICICVYIYNTKWVGQHTCIYIYICICIYIYNAKWVWRHTYTYIYIYIYIYVYIYVTQNELDDTRVSNKSSNSFCVINRSSNMYLYTYIYIDVYVWYIYVNTHIGI